MESQTSPDQIIHDLGGCGRYQIRMNVIVHMMKSVVCFSIMSMVLMSATPPWWCEDNVAMSMKNMTSCKSTENGSDIIICPMTSCFTSNDTTCQNFAFGSKMKTVVSEVRILNNNLMISILYPNSDGHFFLQQTDVIVMTLISLLFMIRTCG